MKYYFNPNSPVYGSIRFYGFEFDVPYEEAPENKVISVFNGYDDCIALKSGKDNEVIEVNRAHLLTEKEYHSYKFNKQVDDIFKD